MVQQWRRNCTYLERVGVVRNICEIFFSMPLLLSLPWKLKVLPDRELNYHLWSCNFSPFVFLFASKIHCVIRDRKGAFTRINVEVFPLCRWKNFHPDTFWKINFSSSHDFSSRINSDITIVRCYSKLKGSFLWLNR